MKKILALALLTSVSFAISLPFSVIPEAGFVIGKYTTDESGMDEKWRASGFELGAKASYNIPNTKFYIEPGVYYTYVPFKFENKTETIEGGLHFFKIPINAYYEVYNSEPFSIKLGAGPFLAYRLDGDDKKWEDWDFGLSLGASFTYLDQFVVDARFDLGLKDIAKGSGERKTRAFVFDVGYKFNF